MQSPRGVPAEVAAVVLPPPEEPGVDRALPGGVGLLEDALFYLGLSGISRIFVPGERTGEAAPARPGRQVAAGTSMTPREAACRAAATGRFLVVDSGVIRRQSVPSLMRNPRARGAIALVALSTARSCGGLPLLTSPDGRIARADRAGSDTNAADSGLWLCEPALAGLLPDGPVDTGALLVDLMAAGESLAAEYCEGYTRRPGSPLQYLVACGEILSGGPAPWSGRLPAGGRILLEAGVEIPASAGISGFLWAREGCTIGPGSTLENVVLMPRSSVGEGCDLRNALIQAGCRVRSGTKAADKAPKVLGRSGYAGQD